MVQAGNEINHGILNHGILNHGILNHGILHPDGAYWQPPGSWDALAGLLRAGAGAVREADPRAPVMLHLALGGQNAGTFTLLKGNLTGLAGRYPQRLVMAEYSASNLRAVNAIVHGLPGGKGLGTFIWEPTRWGGPALFFPDGRAKPDLALYPKMAADYR